MKYRVGLVISVFDKIEDLKVCLELAKLAGFHRILVVAEDEELTKSILPSEICDHASLLFVKSVSYIPTETKSKFEFFTKITQRVWQAQKTGLKELAETCDYVMHTHSDGWILDGKAVESIINEMILRNCVLGYRGMGLTFRNFPGSPTGTIDDHFYIVKSVSIKNSLFLDKALIDYLPGYFNIHGILSTWIISEIGVSRAYYYDNTRNWLNWDGTIRNYKNGNPLRSYVYSSKFSLLHCHSDDFPDSYGKALQVKHIKNVKHYEKSSILKKFVFDYENENIIADLKKIYKKKRVLLNLTLNFNEDYRNLALMDKILVDFTKNPLKTIAYNLMKALYRTLNRNKNVQIGPLFPNAINNIYNKISYKSELEEKAREKVIRNQ